MPRLSYPGGRKASALQVAPKADKSGSIKLSDQVGDGLYESPNETIHEVPTGVESPRPPAAEVVQDPSEALKTQIEALRKSEREALNRAEVAERKASEEAHRRESEGFRSQEQIMNSNVDAISAALAAATSEAEMAQDAIEAAIQMQDGKGQAEAYRKMSTATAKIFQLEQGKEAAERELQALKDSPPAPAPKPVDDMETALNKTALPYVAKQWLLAHPEYIRDEKKNRKIAVIHDDLTDEGIVPYSPQYFDLAEQRLGMRPVKPEVEEVVEEDKPIQSERRIYSAPPSRDVPTSSGRREDSVTLNAAQKEAAKIAGITEKEYALQVRKLKNEKMNGNYGGAP